MKQNDLIYWKQFKSGDQSALGKIFEMYFREMYYYGLKIIHIPDIVKDVIQEMFVRLWERRDSIGDVKKVKSYLLVTLRNELMHIMKNDRFSEMENGIDIKSFDLTIEDFIISNESSKDLYKQLVNSLNQLSQRQREVIILRFYNNLGFNEIATMLNINVQSVRNLLFRALEKIREDLKDIDFHNAENIEIILFNLFR